MAAQSPAGPAWGRPPSAACVGPRGPCPAAVAVVGPRERARSRPSSGVGAEVRGAPAAAAPRPSRPARLPPHWLPSRPRATCASAGPHCPRGRSPSVRHRWGWLNPSPPLRLLGRHLPGGTPPGARTPGPLSPPVSRCVVAPGSSLLGAGTFGFGLFVVFRGVLKSAWCVIHRLLLSKSIFLSVTWVPRRCGRSGDA